MTADGCFLRKALQRESGSSDGEWTRRPRVAEKPWRTVRLPSGPISPAQKSPATGTSRNAAWTAAASLLGVLKRLVPRPLRVQRIPATIRRSSVAATRGAEVELDRLADPGHAADDDRAVLLVDPDYPTNDEIATVELVPVLIDGESDDEAGHRLQAPRFGE